MVVIMKRGFTPEELEKAIGESKDANGSSQLSRTKEEREKKIH